MTATQAIVNQPPLPPQQNVTNPKAEIPLHSDLVQNPQVAGYVQLPSTEL